MCKLDNLFKPIVANASSVLESHVSLCYQGGMPFLNMSDASLKF